VNSDLAPAIVAAGGGSAMIAGIWLHEHRRDEAMRASRVRLGMRFPLGLEPTQALAAVESLTGVGASAELVAEVSARAGHIEHALWVPAASAPALRTALAGAIPSLHMAESPTPRGSATFALRLHLSTPVMLHTGNAESVSRGLLAGMASVREGEQVVLRWALRAGSPRVRETEPKTTRERQVEQAWRRKSALPGLFVNGLVLVRADGQARARELADQLASLIRARVATGESVRITSERSGRRLASLPQVSRGSGWLSGVELLPLLAWPMGADVAPGVTLGGRELAAPSHLSRSGRRLFMGRDLGGERWVAIGPEAARLHTVVAGASGSGKSELLARGIVDEIAAGHAGAVIDPKADLIQTVLDQIPAEHADRVVVLDPGDDSRPTPGVDVLRGGDPDLRTDVLIGALKSIFSDWGIRSETYGRLALRSLAEMPGSTLADAGRLFSSEPFLREVIGRLRDPYLIEAWRQYLALPPGSRVEHVQAPMARVAALLARPRVRAVLASPDPKLDVARLFAEGKWLLVSLAPGQLGEAGASIVGAALTHLIWSAIEARVSLPAGRRRFVSVYLDELATLTGGVPFSFELLAERARGLGAGLTVAVQTLGRVPEPTRSALLGNSGSFITFTAPAEESSRVARQLPGLGEADVRALGRFQVAARITTAGAVSTVTGRTLPLPNPTGQAGAIRDRSAARYGSSLLPSEPTSEPQAASHEPEEPPLGRTGRAA
jgi:hypothetical protein